MIIINKLHVIIHVLDKLTKLIFLVSDGVKKTVNFMVPYNVRIHNISRKCCDIVRKISTLQFTFTIVQDTYTLSDTQ